MTSPATSICALLADRGIVSVSGEDAAKLLQGLVTNDLARLEHTGDAAHTALLTPQGKILFDFLVVKAGSGYLLDAPADKAGDLVKRLKLYKLRARVDLADATGTMTVFACWGAIPPPGAAVVTFRDPRHEDLGYRQIVPSDSSDRHCPAPSSSALYLAHRVRLGIPEGGKDYPFGDAFPHEARMDELHGVSFTKGCYVGQEVVSRMEHRSTARKRVTLVHAKAPLASGTEIKTGDIVIGTIGSSAGQDALALLRLDRTVEALDKGAVISADGQPLEIDPGTLARFRARMAEKAAHD